MDVVHDVVQAASFDQQVGELGAGGTDAVAQWLYYLVFLDTLNCQRGISVSFIQLVVLLWSQVESGVNVLISCEPLDIYVFVEKCPVDYTSVVISLGPGQKTHLQDGLIDFIYGVSNFVD